MDEERSPRAGPARRNAPTRALGQPGAEGLDSSVPVVGIGASAGGLDALNHLFAAIPADSGLAFVVIQHLDPAHASHLAELLGSKAAIPAVEAADGMALAPDTIYVIPPNQYLTIQEGALHLVRPVKHGGTRMPIDFFLRSLAEDQHERAMCVILSGTGADGTLGLRAIRGAGGLAIAQDPATAEFDAMPRNAIATGLVDFVLATSEIAQALLGYARYVRRNVGAELGASADGVGEIVKLLLLKVNSDFRGYKHGTLLRRIERRVGITQAGDLANYTRLLRADVEEARRLAKDILIGVTGFLRDPEAYAELRSLAIAPLVAGKDNDAPIRVWVPGCATGEEAYSVAMLVMDELDAVDKTCPVQVFASDIDDGALTFARGGTYPESIASDIPREQIERFFIREDGSYRVSRQLREAVTFVAQNVLTDPPYSRLDLISCRNVLIYLDSAAQRRVTSLFGFALTPGGYLFLGRSDSLEDGDEAFEQLTKRWRIYRRTAVPRREILGFPSGARRPLALGRPDGMAPLAQPTSLMALSQQALLSHFSASSVLIDSKGTILFFYGDTERYLRHPTGGADLNLFAMAKSGLARRLRTRARQALQTGEPVRIEQFPIGDGAAVDVTILPLRDPRAPEPILSVVFEQSGKPAPIAPVAGPETPVDASLVELLEADLKAAREEVQSVSAEFQASDEELRATHEEAMSMNEELQSTNEELETSKEELQSTNEELLTVNNELQEKILELNRVNNDLANLLNSTAIAAVFLDRQLRIRRFTPAATELFRVIAADVGRYVGDITQRFNGTELSELAEQVMRDLVPVEREVRTAEGQWHTMRLLPYRTVDDRIEGVVATFSDVTRLKQAEQASEDARAYAESIVATVRGPLVVLDSDLRTVFANRAFYDTFRTSPEKVEGRLIYEIADWDTPGLRQLLEEVISNNPIVRDLELERDFAGIGPRTMLFYAQSLKRSEGHPQLMLLAIEDISDRKQAEMNQARLLELERARAELARVLGTEISHRTKNNLAIVAGMLQIQADSRPKGSLDAGALLDAITRIRVFATLFEHMHETQGEQVDLFRAIGRIAETDRLLLSAVGAAISVEGEPVFYDAQVGTNLCIMANELMTNGMKYGAPDLTGVLQIVVRVVLEKGTLSLSFWNSGNPIAPDFDVKSAGETGLRILESLVESYEGSLTLEPHEGGTMARIVFEDRILRASA